MARFPLNLSLFAYGVKFCLPLILGYFTVFSRIAIASESLCPKALPEEIEKIINAPEFERSRWGILVRSLESDGDLYALNARSYFLPASNAKLLTTAAALHYFGANYRIQTPIYTIGNAPHLKRLYLRGQGDPSLTSQHLQQLARNLRDRGIQSIDELVVEDGNFSQLTRHPTWEHYDLNFYYGAAVNRLILNENTFNLTLYPQQEGQPLRLEWNDEIAAQQWRINNQTQTSVFDAPYRVNITGILGQSLLNITGELAVNADPDPWGMAILDPSRYFLDTLQYWLESEGIIVSQTNIVNRPQMVKSKREREAIASPPLAVLIRDTNQPSNNLYAEALLNLLGEHSRKPRLNALETVLTDLGVESASHQLADGSGLSRHNLLSPEGIVQTLQAMTRSPQGEIYRDSLPVAGTNGTLRNRFRDTPLEGILQAKTGTMTGVSALSGYLEVPQYQSLIFSIVINNSDRSIREQRNAIDRIVLLLWQLRSGPTC